MPTLKYWDIATGAYVALAGPQGPQGVIGNQGPQGAMGPVGRAGNAVPVGTWTNMTGSYGANWADYGGAYRPGSYMQDALGWVYLRGLVNFSAMTSSGGQAGISAYTLPSGLHPLYEELFEVQCGSWSSAGGMGRICIHTDGTIYWSNSGPANSPVPCWISFEGIRFMGDGS